MLHDRLGDRPDDASSMSGARLLAALLHSDDPTLQAVLATADDLAGLRAATVG